MSYIGLYNQNNGGGSGGGGSGVTPKQIQDEVYVFGPDTGGASDIYVVALSPAVGAYVDGLSFRMVPANNNLTTTPTLNVGTGGALVILGPGGAALSANDLVDQVPADFVYYNGNFYLQNPATAGSGGGVTPAQVQEWSFNTGTDSGIADAYVVALTPAITGSIPDGTVVSFFPNFSNSTTIPTLDVGTGPIPMVSSNFTGTARPNDINSNTNCVAVWRANSFTWQILNPMSYMTDDFYGDSGSADAYVIAINPPTPVYYEGLTFWMLPSSSNTTTTPTLDAGPGALPIQSLSQSAINVGDIKAGVPAQFIVHANAFLLINPGGDPVSPADIQKSSFTSDINTIGTDNYISTFNPAIEPANFVRGTTLTFTPPFTSISGSPTLDVGTGANSIVRSNGAPLIAGDIIAGCPSVVIYGGGPWYLQNPATVNNPAFNFPANIYKPGLVTNNPISRFSATVLHITFQGAGWAVGGLVPPTGTIPIDFTTVGAGGLDSGTVTPSTLYFICAISNLGDNTSNVIASTSFSNPTMPMGYTTYAAFGVVGTDGAGDLYPFVCTATGPYSSQMVFTPGISVLSGGTSTGTALNIAPYDTLYSGIFKIKFSYTFTTTTPGNSFFVSSYNHTDSEITISSSVAAVAQKGCFEIDFDCSASSLLLSYGVTNAGTDTLDLTLTAIEFVNPLFIG